MNIRLIIISIFLSIFSTAVMAYIAMATPIGPWIGPTLALLAAVLFKFFGLQKNVIKEQSLAVAAGSIGGIIATAFGFSYPTLYFLSPNSWNELVSNPVYFCAITGGLALSAGAFGFFIADLFEHRLIIEQKLVFPIGELVYKVITSLQNSMRKTYELLTGFVSTTIFCMLQDGFLGFKGFIPRALTLIGAQTWGALTLPAIRFDLWPIWWAIGYVSGYLIAVPLFVGFLSRIFIAEPINYFFFQGLSTMDFILAFGTGIVLSGALVGMIKTPMVLWKTIRVTPSRKGVMDFKHWGFRDKNHILEGLFVFISLIFFLTLAQFTFWEQVYLIPLTFICAYQIVLIAGKTGLALLGRFATFVMVPAILFFGITDMQIAIVSTFVEVVGGVATDVLFGRKMANLAKIQRTQIRRYQTLGLIISSAVVGIVLWLLINHFGLGSDQLFAQRAQARALLVSIKQFDVAVMVLGILFGNLLKWCKVSPMMVLGGLIMPFNITLGLVTGGLIAYFSKDQEENIPFWSGVFAAQSLWMLTKALV